MPPQSVEVMAAEQPGLWKKVGTVVPTQPTKYEPNRVEAAALNKGGKFRYWKISVAPVTKLPKWHSGKGENGWIMVDEVFFYPPQASR